MNWTADQEDSVWVFRKDGAFSFQAEGLSEEDAADLVTALKQIVALRGVARALVSSVDGYADFDNALHPDNIRPIGEEARKALKIRAAVTKTVTIC